MRSDHLSKHVKTHSQNGEGKKSGDEDSDSENSQTHGGPGSASSPGSVSTPPLSAQSAQGLPPGPPGMMPGMMAAHPAAAAYSMGLPHVGYPAPHQMHEQPPGGGIDMKPIV